MQADDSLEFAASLITQADGLLIGAGAGMGEHRLAKRNLPDPLAN